MAVLKFAKKKVIKKKVKTKPARKVIKKSIVKKPLKKKNNIKVGLKKQNMVAKSKKALKVKKAVLPKPEAGIGEEFIGAVTHYFPKVKAAVVVLKATLNIGDKIHIKGHTSDFIQVVNSMQIEHLPITSAKKGDEIGMGVISRVRRDDRVYRVTV
ncbi:MAG: hypothetical protein Q8L26_01900 [Candidatus Omnitrophota bacterium]|nr:hypothetical protein [Candidatus Omnitrophota bacterium]